MPLLVLDNFVGGELRRYEGMVDVVVLAFLLINAFVVRFLRMLLPHTNLELKAFIEF